MSGLTECEQSPGRWREETCLKRRCVLPSLVERNVVSQYKKGVYSWTSLKGAERYNKAAAKSSQATILWKRLSGLNQRWTEEGESEGKRGWTDRDAFDQVHL